MRRRRWPAEAEEHGVRPLVDAVRQQAQPLRGPADLEPLLKRIGDSHFVLLGEASHGTAGLCSFLPENVKIAKVGSYLPSPDYHFQE